MKRFLVVGNWKMNGLSATNADLLGALLRPSPTRDRVDIAVCVPAPYLAQAQLICQGSDLVWGAQDVSAHESGAYTGEVSAAMLHDFKARYVLVGHSERRQYHGESSSVVAAKAQRALAKGITPIVCVGETLQEREAGQTEDVVKRQLAAVIQQVGHCASEMVVAYEPVWAIGTGEVASPEQAQEMHARIRTWLRERFDADTASIMALLYGGSVKPDNAAALFGQKDINGGLIGGASLKADDFLALLDALRSA